MSKVEHTQNVFWFSAATMRGVYEQISEWQKTEKKRILSFHMEKDGDEFCAIVATNPMEVIIKDGTSQGGASVSRQSNGAYCLNAR